MAKHLITMAVIMPLAAGLAASVTQAKEPGIPRGAKTFERLDKDKNGKLELSELLEGCCTGRGRQTCSTRTPALVLPNWPAPEFWATTSAMRCMRPTASITD